MAAAAADPQMQPFAAGLEAFLAAERAWRDLTDAGDMGAALCHFSSPRLRRQSAGLAVSPRKACSAATTWAPSPIAPPTRLTEPDRTSPTAKTPGTEVSSADDRLRCPPLPGAPVMTKPARSTITPQPLSQ